MLKLIYYVPESHLESTKLAIFEVGSISNTNTSKYNDVNKRSE